MCGSHAGPHLSRTLQSSETDRDPEQVNCRCHVERELPRGLYEGPDRRLVCVGWDGG